jgi:hypothetical protein
MACTSDWDCGLRMQTVVPPCQLLSKRDKSLNVRCGLKINICTSYVEFADGPSPSQNWLCWRCAQDARGGIKRNWIRPRTVAKLKENDLIYFSRQLDDDLPSAYFYRGFIVTVDTTFVRVLWPDFQVDDSNPELVPRESCRIWHGSMGKDVWEQDQRDPLTFSPKSRKYCPATFAEIAIAHGIRNYVLPSRVVPVVRVSGHDASQPAAGPSPGFQHNSLPAMPNATDRSSRPQVVPGLQVHALSGDGSRRVNGEGYAREAQRWIEKVNAFGRSIGDVALATMPEFLSFRKDFFVHAYAFWQVVMVRFCLCAHRHYP